MARLAKDRGIQKLIDRSHRRFTRELNRWNNYLVDGDWRTSYHSLSTVDGDEIIHSGGDPGFRDERNYQIEFDILTNGRLSATRTFTRDGETYSQEYIGMIDPWAKQFVMTSVDGVAEMLGTITPKEDALTILVYGQGQTWDRVFITVNFVDVG